VRVARGLYAAGALALLGEGTVHLQQFAALFYGVRWIGPLFLANAAACAFAIAGLTGRSTRPLAALVGSAVSALALAGLVVSYGDGLFGWMEFGLRPPVAVALACELAAVLALTAALAVDDRATAAARPAV
jgi:hypothetical protein